MPLVLASKSPRRKVLLGMLLDDFEVHAVDVEEVAPRSLPIGDAVQVIARKKAMAASKELPGQWVLGADTVVAFNGHLIGKARDETTARQHLATLSGSTHQITTGIALAMDGQAVDADHAVTALHVERMPASVVDAYVKSGQWLGKAGGFGIQDPLISPFLTIKAGPWSNVVGLPLSLTRDMLTRNNIGCREAPDERILEARNPFLD